MVILRYILSIRKIILLINAQQQTLSDGTSINIVQSSVYAFNRHFYMYVKFEINYNYINNNNVSGDIK